MTTGAPEPQVTPDEAIAELWSRGELAYKLLPKPRPALRYAVIAAALADVPGALVHLIESTKKKAAFLSEAARQIGAPVKVHPVRIEDFVNNATPKPDVVTARALAPLDKLFAWAHPLLSRDVPAFFLKGQDVEAELTEASKSWSIETTLIPSLTDPRGRIVHVRGLKRRKPPP